MTSSRKQEANRRNAAASTGPRTAAGKARSARNAGRHGLAVPIWSELKLAADAEALARLLAGDPTNAERIALARRIAEAQIDLARIRRARHDLLMDELCNFGVWNYRQNETPMPGEMELFRIRSGFPSPEKMALIMSDSSERLKRMDRYERRALSRRKSAIRAFEAYRAGCKPPTAAKSCTGTC